ncbi:hypothetical protein [Burkholderia territorii]|uniref:hypothetical protein n=1 Tax=Burkholderia territorii TaxID=1503055 RepID=UPI0012D8D420|nr:hypothetical protein [Burkholderia territorii]
MCDIGDQFFSKAGERAKDRAVEHRSEGRGINDADIGAAIHRMTPFLGRIRIVDLSRVPSGCHEASVMSARRHAHCDDAPGQPSRASTVRDAAAAGRMIAFIYLSHAFHPKSDSRRSHFWPILFCTGR